MAWLEIGEPEAGAALAERARQRLERRIAAGTIDVEEIERVSRSEIRLFGPDGASAEAFRRLFVVARIDAPVPLQSHRPIVGAALVALKRVVARVLRFQLEVPLARQAEFNRNLLVVLQELFDRLPPRDGGRSERP